MESKWRQNVPEAGMADSTWLMAARTLSSEPGFTEWLVNEGPSASWNVFWQFNSELPFHVFDVERDGNFPHPWSDVVEPDH